MRNKWLKYNDTASPVNDRIISVSLNLTGGKVTFISNHSHTAKANHDHKADHCDLLSKVIFNEHNATTVGGDFNDRIYNIFDGERLHKGELKREQGYVRESLSEQSKEN